MSNLATTGNVDMSALLELAAEFNIPLHSEAEESTSNRIWTNFTNIPDDVGGIRVLTSSWMDGAAAGAFLWTDPQNKDAAYEEAVFDEFSNVNRLTGFVVHVELQSSLGYYNQSTGKSKTFCSTTGYMKEGQLVKGLPGYVSWNRMYDWVNKKLSTTTPHKVVGELGLVGSQGMACANCIKSGCSTREVEMDDGSTKTVDCKVTGRMFFYVTEVSRVKKIPPKVKGEAPEVKVVTKTIRELLGVSGVLVMIKLPTSTGLKGNYNPDKPEENIQGYSSYLMRLRIENKGKSPLLASPLMHQTTLDIRQPSVESKSPKNMMEFTGSNSFEQGLWKDANNAWKNIKPESLKEVVVLDPSKFHKNAEQSLAAGGALSVAASEVVDVPALRYADAEVLEDEGDTPF